MDIEALTKSIQNILLKNNTTTSSDDLSDNLGTKVGGVSIGVRGQHENLPVHLFAYPFVSVEAGSARHEFAELGNNRRRDIFPIWDLVGVTHTGAGSANERIGRENADIEAMRLSKNLEGIIQNNITISSTVDWIRVANIEYAADVGEKTYNSIVKLTLEGKVRI